MRTLQQIRDTLAACKGTGRWRLIAAHAGCTYDTLTKVYRDDIESPGILLCERIDAAIDATEPAQAEKAGA